MFFLVGLSTMLIILFLLFPNTGINIGKLQLNFISKKEFYKPIIKTNQDVELPINIDSIKEVDQHIQDSIEKVKQILFQKYLDSVLIAEKRIQYPNNDVSILYPFFEKLLKAKINKVRIMHYGDSQIEADRISGRLRQRLQKEFGGYGSGLNAVIPATRKISIRNKLSNNWVRRTGFGPYVDTIVKHKNYGAIFSFCEITPDTNLLDSVFYDGIIKIYKPIKSYKKARNFQELNIYYSSIEESYISYTINDTIIFLDTLNSTNSIKKKSLSFNKAPESIEIQIKSSMSPLIYGLSLEGENGIVVDNIPLRGASGTEFAKIDYSSLKQMHHLLMPDFFILEFGGNAIPHIKNKDRAKNYGKFFKKQINKIKKINPKSIVLVIGPGDMAKKEKTELISYPLIEEVRDALKKAAFETNSCFWDMYLNMGGENSIIDWSKKTPSLAARDYIHFTNKGAREIADLFIEDFMNDFKNYLEYKNEN